VVERNTNLLLGKVVVGLLWLGFSDRCPWRGGHCTFGVEQVSATRPQSEPDQRAENLESSLTAIIFGLIAAHRGLRGVVPCFRRLTVQDNSGGSALPCISFARAGSIPCWPRFVRPSCHARFLLCVTRSCGTKLYGTRLHGTRLRAMECAWTGICFAAGFVVFLAGAGEACWVGCEVWATAIPCTATQSHAAESGYLPPILSEASHANNVRLNKKSAKPGHIMTPKPGMDCQFRRIALISYGSVPARNTVPSCALEPRCRTRNTTSCPLFSDDSIFVKSSGLLTGCLFTSSTTSPRFNPTSSANAPCFHVGHHHALAGRNAPADPPDRA